MFLGTSTWICVFTINRTWRLEERILLAEHIASVYTCLIRLVNQICSLLRCINHAFRLWPTIIESWVWFLPGCALFWFQTHFCCQQLMTVPCLKQVWVFSCNLFREGDLISVLVRFKAMRNLRNFFIAFGFCCLVIHFDENSFCCCNCTAYSNEKWCWRKTFIGHSQFHAPSTYS